MNEFGYRLISFFDFIKIAEETFENKFFQETVVTTLPALQLAPTSKGLPDLFHSDVTKAQVISHQARDRLHAVHYTFNYGLASG